jgi:hypothetical protein
LILLLIFLAACDQTAQTGDNTPNSSELTELKDLKERSYKSNQPLLNQLTVLLTSIKENQGIPVNYYALEDFSKKAADASSAKVQDIQKKTWSPKFEALAQSSLQREMQFSQLASEDVPRMLYILKNTEGKVSIEELSFIDTKLRAIEANQEKIEKLFQEIEASL